MENFPSDSDLKSVVRELCEGKELAKQLQNHLNLQPSSSYESREFLLQRIMYSYEHALSMLTHNAAEAPPPPPAGNSPRSRAGSPHSDDSDQDLASRKRKTVERWSEKVKVGPEGGIEGQLDDGYGWRKYGQKDILGAKYPRGYYRCTHRHAYGCMATKQVQRSDEDPTTFEITYRRKHTCNRGGNTTNNLNNSPLPIPIPIPIPIPDPQNEDPNPSTENPLYEPPFNIQTSLKVITPDLGTNSHDPFNFPSSSTINPETNHVYSDHNDVLGNYYPVQINDLNDNYGDLIPNLRHSESELCPIVAAMTSSTNSVTLDIDFPFGPSEFGSGFDFGNSGHYP